MAMVLDCYIADFHVLYSYFRLLSVETPTKSNEKELNEQ